MDMKRREAMKAGGGIGVFGLLVAAGMIKPGMAIAAQERTAFEARSMEDAFAALNAGSPAESADVTIVGPDIAENGAVVPVGVSSSLSNVEHIAILIEQNPSKVAATFELAEGTLADVQTRVKMGQTSDVYAVVKADGKFYMAKKEIKVTLGGCGG